MRKLFKLHIVYSTESAITNAHICIETLAVCYISKTKYDNNKYIAPPNQSWGYRIVIADHFRSDHDHE